MEQITLWCTLLSSIITYQYAIRTLKATYNLKSVCNDATFLNQSIYFTNVFNTTKGKYEKFVKGRFHKTQ